MRVLVLGGTVFLSYATAAAAAARGHDVTCAARGISGQDPPGSRFVRLDRERPDWSLLGGRSWDVVVDVDRTESWLFVSTCSVYADQSTPGAGTDAELLPAAGEDVDETDPARYSELKVACERAVSDRLGERALQVRPGLIVGPGDPSGRFAYWPHRMAESTTVLAPGDPDDPVQVVDVRDLAQWLVLAAEEGRRGVFDATGPVMPRGQVLEAIADGVGTEPRLVWVPQEFLLANGVQPWMGERSLPLWLPMPDYAGLMSRDVGPTLAAGLTVRPVEDTARDTFDWLQQTPRASITGLTAAEQRDLLHRCHHVDLKLS